MSTNAPESKPVAATTALASSSEESARKPYEKPTLQRLGSVKDLTFATRMGLFPDGAGRMAVM